jgi:hypothetical protein
VLEKKHRWHSLENIDAIRVALQKSPSKSTGEAAA